jgi:hypothetical protein
MPESTAPAIDARSETAMSGPTPVMHAERIAEGKSLRKRIPRPAHACWQPPPGRPDVVDLLRSADAGRVPELLPIRYGRMLASPLAFLRGSAGVMAFDLAGTPGTGVHVQLCGDCHLLNFGGFASPERRFLFDMTDFDETLPGPWEWDVKRLAASLFVAGRTQHFADEKCAKATRACVRAYRRSVRRFAARGILDRWYARVDGREFLAMMRGAGDGRNDDGPAGEDFLPHPPEHVPLKLKHLVNGQRRIRDRPPLVYHPPSGDGFESQVRRLLDRYRATLQEDRRKLLDRFRLEDVAVKVVGVGSVGTRCAVVLLTAGPTDVLVLQYKEAGPSVLEPYAGKSRYRTHGQRVVCGQRLLQTASDIFLGWAEDPEPRDFYFRQLRDGKTTVRLERLSPSGLSDYAALCGRALARGHAKSGEPALIAGYLGRRGSFDRAVTRFARAYADQTARDYEVLVTAVRSGRIMARMDGQRQDQRNGLNHRSRSARAD